VYTFYQYKDSLWNEYYTLSYHPQIKPATTGTTGDYPYNGMGRVELPMNMVNDVNTLTQDMLYKGAQGFREPNTNTIFVIRYDFTLGEDITIPDNCVLEFDGGSISGAYTLTGNGTGIHASLVQIFSADIVLSGTWSCEALYPENFGSIDFSNASRDDYNYIQAALDNAKTSGIKIVKLQPKAYITESTLNIYSYTALLGTKGNDGWGNGTAIYPNGCHGIELKSADNSGIRGITIEDIEIRTNDNSYDGIVAHGAGEEEIQNIYLSNIHVEYSRYGVYFTNGDLSSLVGICCIVVRGSYFNRNKIGIYIDGGYQKTTSSRGSYISTNSFENCTFQNNSIGGCLISRMGGMSYCNNFIGCSFEACGRGYNMEDYAEFGVFGIKAWLDNGVMQGNINVTNCYFEYSIPRREGAASADEETIDGITYPKNYAYSQNVGEILVKEYQASITGCNFVGSSRIVIAGNNSYINFKNNRVVSAYTGISILPIVTTLNNSSNPADYPVVSMSGNSYTDGLDVSKIEAFVTNGNCTEGKYINEDDGQNIEVYNQKSGIFYVNGAATYPSGILYVAGATPVRPCNVIGRMFNFIKNTPLDKLIRIKVLGTVGIGWGGMNNTTPDSGVIYPKALVYSDNKQKLGLGKGSYGGQCPIFYDALFKNLTIDSDNNEIQMFTLNGLYVNDIVFEDCDITVDTSLFLDSTSAKKLIRFRNCTFNFTGRGSWGTTTNCVFTFEYCSSNIAYPVGATVIDSQVI
jgi:hypothetical protein